MVAAEVMVMPRSRSCSIQSMMVGPVVDLAHAVDAAGVEQDALGQGGLAGIDVGHDADVPYPFQCVATHHCSFAAGTGRTSPYQR